MNVHVRPTAVNPLSRRTVIANAGLAAAALAGLGACSSYGGEPPSPVTSAGGEPASPVTSAATPSGAADTAIKTADIPVGGGKIFPDLQAVVTQPTAGKFKAFSSTCTHQGCQVAEVVETINCPCHGSKFSIADGSVVQPPAPSPLPAKTVTVNGDSLTVS